MTSSSEIRVPADRVDDPPVRAVSVRAASVLIADRDALFRTGLSRVLSGRCGFDVVAETGSGAQADRLIRSCSPRILVVETQLARSMGLYAGRLAERPGHGPGLVLIGDEPVSDGLEEALAAGARGFVPRTLDARLLEAVLRHVLAGGCALGGEAFGALTGGRGRTSSPRFEGHHRRIALLSERELEVLGLLGRGLENVRIAEQLRLSQASVKTYVSRLLSKLHLENRTQAALVANETGLADALGVPV